MGLLRKIALGVLIVSFITFVALFGRLPALRNTPIGWLQRALCMHLPATLRRVDVVVTGGCVTVRGQRVGNYLFYKKNPVVLVCFLVLLSGSIFLFLQQAVNRLTLGLWAPVLILVPLPYVFTYLCVSYKAHYITSSNHNARLHDYPYDHILYRPGILCSTCSIVKPARSKHCSLCGFCVAKCDHHCPWVNNCLGRGNYGYFLALLLSLSAVQSYGAYLSWWLLRPSIHINTSTPLFSKARLGEIGKAIGVAVNVGGISIAGVGFLAAATAVLPFALFLYHLYLIWAGMTTNESQKWTDWRDDIDVDCVFKANRKALKEHNLRKKQDESASGDSPAVHRNPALAVIEEASEPYIAWPFSSLETLVRTNDQNPPRGQEELWTRVHSLNEMENIYDLGTWRNLSDVFHGI